MSMLDLSKIRYSSYFQGLGNIEPLPEYQFNIPQINATRIGGPVSFSWIVPSSSYTFTIPVSRPDLLSSVLFSIRDVNTGLNIYNGLPWHSWATSIITDANTLGAKYLTHYESMRGTYETQIHSSQLVPAPAPFDYFMINNRGLYTSPSYAKLVIRSWLDNNNLIFNVQIIGGQIGTGANGENNPTNKALAPSILRVKLKQYIAPWNM